MFEFIQPEPMIDDDLELVVSEMVSANPALDLVPAYKFRMVRRPDNVTVGRIDLRVGSPRVITMYAGHIGYSVEPAYRGHRYAARAVQLLIPLARHHDLSPLWITCNPDNYASRRTCELVGAEMVEIVDLPHDNDMYLIGERHKCRYRLDIWQALPALH